MGDKDLTISKSDKLKSLGIHTKKAPLTVHSKKWCRQ